MNTNKVNVQNDGFFADLHGAFNRLEGELGDLPVVLTGQGDVFRLGSIFSTASRSSAAGATTKSVIGIGRIARRIQDLQVPEAYGCSSERSCHRWRAHHGT